jgi:hypothetical protein
MNTLIHTWIREQSAKERSNIVTQLKAILSDDISDDVLVTLYDKSISIFQSRKCKSGKQFESVIEEMLTHEKIPYRTQVAINEQGIILGFGTLVGNQAHVVDIVIGRGFEIGKSITDFTVASCKTSSRERWNQDEWSTTHKPKLYLLCTLSDDYPQPKKFKEDSTRKIVTLNPKKKDARKYTLDFDDMIQELVIDDILDDIYPVT